MKITKKALQDALAVVKPGLANTEVVEQATSFSFFKGRVVTFDNEVSISHPVSGLEDLSGGIVAEKLYQLLDKLSVEDTFELAITLNKQNSELVVKAGRMKAGLKMQGEVLFPIDIERDLANHGDWQKLPDEFVKRVEFVMSSSTDNLKKPILMTVHVNKAGFVEASDDYCIAHYNLPSEMPVKTFLLPISAAPRMIRFNPTEVAMGDGWVHFRKPTELNEDEYATYSCRVFHDDFPNTARFLDVKGMRLTLPDNINDAVERAWIFAKREDALDETLTLTLFNKHLRIRSEADTGWFEEEVYVDYSGDKLCFGITPFLLHDILVKTTLCTLGKDRIKFEGTDWIFVSALKTVKDE